MQTAILARQAVLRASAAAISRHLDGPHGPSEPNDRPSSFAGFAGRRASSLALAVDR